MIHSYYVFILLPRYQFNPAFFQTTVTAQILLKALTNLPHTDFTLCKCMIDQAHVSFQLLGLGGCRRAGAGECCVSSATNPEYLPTPGVAWCWVGLGLLWLRPTWPLPSQSSQSSGRDRSPVSDSLE